jgi:hypothetical protein
MQTQRFSVPLIRAAVWSVAPLLQPSSDPFLEIGSGSLDLGFIDPLLRRRLGPLGRAMLHCAGRVAEGLGPLPSVFASRHGDVARTVPILEDLARALPVSPIQFSMNVQNAVAGIWSIVRHDPSPSTSLAAGPETFGLGLLEALGLHTSDPTSPVLFVYADEPLPDPFKAFAEQELPLHAVAMLIGLPATRCLGFTREPEASGSLAPVPQSLQVLQVLQSGQAQGPWLEAGAAWLWQMN